MNGVSNFSSPGDLDLNAFLAGNDILLMSKDVISGINKIELAYNKGRINESRLSHSVKKILYAKLIGRGGSWLDTGNIKDFNDASNFIATIESRQGLKIACLEEIAFNNKWINKNNLKLSIKFYGNCDYSRYLKKLI